MEFHFLRGTSGELDVANPLVLRNPSQEDSRYRANPTHPFFFVSQKPFDDETLAFAESYALQSATQTGLKPQVLSFLIDEKDFGKLNKRIFRLRLDRNTNQFIESPILTPEELMTANQVLLDGTGLQEADWEALHLEIGTVEAEGKFAYKEYAPHNGVEGNVFSGENAA